MRSLFVRGSLAVLLTAGTTLATPQQPYRTHNDRFEAPRFASKADWERRAGYVRAHVLASAGLLPLPDKAPLSAEVFDEISRDGYRVAKVFFESLPGFYVTGNLYRPTAAGPHPAVLSPHGHWAYGRLENTVTASGPARAINLARQGFVVFSYDMVGYNDAQQLPHTFGGRREALWGLSLSGLQLWNSIRALDFLESLPDVRKEAIGATGESGGGTQTFQLAAVDPRVAVAAPVNMISLHMQGGCLCENTPGLRLDINNVEIAATIAPRPLLMVSATGDWTKETLEVEYPAMRDIYALLGAADKVHAVRIDAEHNYNRQSREAMYAWMARWLQQAPEGTVRAERGFAVEPLENLLVFHRRALPAGAVTQPQFVERWITAARRQLESMPVPVAAEALRHALGVGEPTPAAAPVPAPPSKTVLIATTDAAVRTAVTAAGYTIRPVVFTPFDATAAAKVRHFETYNRTEASLRVADIVAALRAYPGVAIVADGDAALAAALAVAVVPGASAVLDVGRFETSRDDSFLERLFIPGLRRAGDFQTAARMASGRLVVHNAGTGFLVNGLSTMPQRLTPAEIVAALGRH